MSFQRVGIIGLGLMGGSIAKTIRKKEAAVKIAAYDTQSLETARDSVDQMFASVEELANWANLVVIATPLTEVLSIAKQLVATGSSCTVIDISSVKNSVIPALETLSTNRMELVSTHPMAGREISGFEASTPTLFEGAPWIIVPHQHNRAETLEAVAAWIQLIGARPVCLSCEEHDAQVALISHLPLMISQALLGFVQKEDSDAISIAGSGFQSMVRLAKTSETLSSELLEQNREMIALYWKKWMKHLGDFYENT